MADGRNGESDYAKVKDADGLGVLGVGDALMVRVGG